MASVSPGDVVRVHYTGSLEDGTVFDSSREGEPLEFEAGSEQLIEGVSSAVIGMVEGESRTVTVPPEKGYGHYDETLAHALAKSDVPEGVEIGDMLRAMRGEEEIHVWVSEIKEDEIILDANHPLAGKTLVFELELVSAEIGGDCCSRNPECG